MKEETFRLVFELIPEQKYPPFYYYLIPEQSSSMKRVPRS